MANELALILKSPVCKSSERRRPTAYCADNLRTAACRRRFTAADTDGKLS